MTRHAEQIASVLHRCVQAILAAGLHDPRVRGLVSVTKVQVSSDIADATVFVSILPEEHSDLTMHGLKHAAPHVRAAVGRRLDMRRVPRLTFKLDRSLKKAAELDAALGEGHHADDPPIESEESEG